MNIKALLKNFFRPIKNIVFVLLYALYDIYRFLICSGVLNRDSIQRHKSTTISNTEYIGVIQLSIKIPYPRSMTVSDRENKRGRARRGSMK